MGCTVERDIKAVRYKVPAIAGMRRHNKKKVKSIKLNYVFFEPRKFFNAQWRQTGAEECSHFK